MKKILTVIGPRPQVIKSAAITRVVRDNFRGELEEVVVHTGQHFDANMSSDFYAEMFLPVPMYQFEIDDSEPLVINQMIQNILSKTIDNTTLQKFDIKTSSDLHKYTKAEFIRPEKTEVFKYKLIHTPSQTVYSSRPHKFQEGYKIFISTTDKYSVFIDNCGMTQSIVFILCSNEEQAKKYLEILKHPLYIFINNICRWGNFNNIRILQSFPIPNIEYSGNHKEIYNYFNITDEEIEYINTNL